MKRLILAVGFILTGGPTASTEPALHASVSSDEVDAVMRRRD